MNIVQLGWLKGTELYVTYQNVLLMHVWCCVTIIFIQCFLCLQRLFSQWTIRKMEQSKLDDIKNDDSFHDDTACTPTLSDTPEKKENNNASVKWLIVLSTSVIYGLTSFSYSAFPVMYVEWIDYFHTSRGETGWISSMPSLASVVLC